MNLRSGLEDSPDWVFWVVFLAGIVVGMAVREWALGNLGKRTRPIKR